MTEQELTLGTVEIRIRKFLCRVRQATEAITYNQCGRGSNPWEYSAIINKLEMEGFLTKSFSERGKTVLNVVEQVSNGAVSASPSLV